MSQTDITRPETFYPEHDFPGKTLKSDSTSDIISKRQQELILQVKDPPKRSWSTGQPTRYNMYPYRWLILTLFVMYSASNAAQWVQYTIIQDIVTKYYGISGSLVAWTSLVYMVTYVPLVFPSCWLLDKTMSMGTRGKRSKERVLRHLIRSHKTKVLCTSKLTLQN